MGAGGRDARDCSTFFLSTSPQKEGPGATLQRDAKLGQFLIQEDLGRGHLGHVYLALDTLSGRDVAIKVVSLKSPSAALASATLKREKAVCDRIQDHRHVVKMHDIHVVCEHDGEILVSSMEYGDGGTLRNWLRLHRTARRIRREQGLPCFQQICEGVRAIHDAGVTHWDLKPENVVLVGGVWKVSDFHLSDFMADPTLRQSARSRNGAATTIFGTPAYMSPEQWRSSHRATVDRRADIYSLGIILYEILDPRCRRPFRGDRETLRELHIRSSPPPVPGAGKTESSVVRRCLQKSPAERYPSIDELLNDLGDCSSCRGPDPEVKSKKEVTKVWQDTLRSFRDGRVNHAQRLCRRVLEGRADDIEAQAMFEGLQERDRHASELYAMVEQGLNGGDLDELSVRLKEATAVCPDHPWGRVLQIRLEVRTQQYREAIQGGLQAMERRNWAAALLCFEKAQLLNPRASIVAMMLAYLKERTELVIKDAVSSGRRRPGTRVEEYVGLAPRALPAPPERGR